MGNSYLKFLVMIFVSTVAMFVMMYLNTYELDHVFFSQTRLYMAIMMGAAMAFLMMAFMWGMYREKRRNVAVLAVSVVVFAICLWLVRSQKTIKDVAWMKAMIPHHSIAIMTSSRENISDPRVRDLADRIIKAQVEEIEEMKTLINNLD